MKNIVQSTILLYNNKNICEVSDNDDEEKNVTNIIPNIHFN